MTAKPTMWFIVSPLVALVVSAAGCAPLAGGRATSGPEDSTEPVPNEGGRFVASEARGDTAGGGEGASPDSGGMQDAAAVTSEQVRPSSTPTGSPIQPSATWSPGSTVGELYAMQDAELGALGTALGASDCESAAQLGDEICRLAERVCGLAPDDERCEVARGHCTRARSRISARCAER